MLGGDENRCLSRCMTPINRRPKPPKRQPLPLLPQALRDQIKALARGPIEDVGAERFVISVLSDEKRALQPRAHSVHRRAGAAERLNRRRFHKRILQAYRVKLKKSPRPKLERYLLTWRGAKASRVLDSMLPKRASRWVPMMRRRAQRVVNFNQLSFFDDPNGALQAMIDLAEAELDGLNVAVNFNFDRCEDIGPYLLLSEVVPFLAPVFSRGRMTPSVQKVLDAVGLRHQLRMQFPGLKDLRDVYAFPVQRRRPTGTSTSISKDLDPQTREAVADQFCEELDYWFYESQTECELSDSGRSHLKNMIGELLCNAERHSSISDKDGSWSVAGFMARRDTENGEEYKCFLAFLSLGDTIPDSLTATAAPQMKAQIDSVVSKLKSTARSPQSKDTLVALTALQDTVTRDAEAFGDSRGGTGLFDVADFVRLLGSRLNGDCTARIAIVSGQSCILMQHPYIQGVRAEPGDGRRLWFNEGNTTDRPPDQRFVFDLQRRLPGTVISVAFTLDRGFFREAYHADRTE